MFTLKEMCVLVVEYDETAFPDLVNVGLDEVGETPVIARAVRVQPFEPIHVEHVHGRRGREFREGLVLDVNLPVRRGQRRLSVNGVSLRRVRNSLPGRHSRLVGVDAPSVRRVLSVIHHDVNEGVTRIAHQTKAGVMVHRSGWMNDDERSAFGWLNGQTDAKRRPVGHAPAEPLRRSSLGSHAHQMHLG